MRRARRPFYEIQMDPDAGKPKTSSDNNDRNSNILEYNKFPLNETGANVKEIRFAFASSNNTNQLNISLYMKRQGKSLEQILLLKAFPFDWKFVREKEGSRWAVPTTKFIGTFSLQLEL